MLEVIIVKGDLVWTGREWTRFKGSARRFYDEQCDFADAFAAEMDAEVIVVRNDGVFDL